MCDLPNLQFVGLAYKDVHIPASWVQLTSLHTMHTSHCPILGHLDMLSRLTRLTSLHVHERQ